MNLKAESLAYEPSSQMQLAAPPTPQLLLNIPQNPPLQYDHRPELNPNNTPPLPKMSQRYSSIY